MTKQEYLDELRKELKLNNVDEIDDIISEFEGHFEFKLEEGLTEEEIVKILSSPKEIAKEYLPKAEPENKLKKGVKVTGLVFLSVPAAMVYVLIWASVIALGGFSVACLVTGGCLITTVNIAELIPYIPYFPALLLGIACIGLSVLSAIGTFYLFMYAKQWGKVYVRWCKNTANDRAYPSISMHPAISKKTAFKLKLVAIIGLVCFLVAFIIGYASMCISAGSFEPWHVWNWFM